MPNKSKSPSSAEVQDDENYLQALDPPPVYSLKVRNLTILAPLAQIPLPLPFAISVPRIWSKSSSAESRKLLRDVSLDCEPGQLLAIIGGSGSGKTTLLNSIAMRLADLQLSSGDVQCVNEQLRTVSASSISSYVPRKIKLSDNGKGAGGVIGYVRQDDWLLPNLTVYETLHFAASLRLPASVDSKTRHQIINQTLIELGLADIANSFVGGAFRKGISGGERRRLSIGCVLVTQPSLLVLDEPTTGLDSFTAHNILALLSNLAHNDRSIIISIHQPPSSAFPLLDKICLLTSGKVAYCGLRSEALPWFSNLGHEPEDTMNPLDFLIDVSSVDTREDEREVETTRTVQRIVDTWSEHSKRLFKDDCERATEQGKDSLQRSVNEISHRPNSGRTIDPEQSNEAALLKIKSKPAKRPNLYYQFIILTQRGLTNVLRDKGQTAGFLAQVLIIGFLTGLAFYRPPETPAGIQTMKTICYQALAANYYISFILFIYIFCQEATVFDRERDDHLYSVLPYVLNLFISFLPLNVICSSIYAIIMYFMTGLRMDDLAKNLFILIAANILMQLSSQGYALAAVGINRSFAQASLIANGMIISFLLSAGYLLTTVPVYVRWIRWINPYYYGFNWIVRSQFHNRTFACDGITGSTANQCIGENVLVGLRIKLSTPMFVYPLGMLGYIVGTHLIAGLLLQFWHPGGQRAAKPQNQTVQNSVQKATVPSRSSDRINIDVHIRNLDLDVITRSIWDISIRELKLKSQSKHILQDVNATFKAGQISAILGPSGAGKSSLLQLLAGHLTPGILSAFRTKGQISFNDFPLGNSTRSLVSFCEQSDHWHLPALTVRETLKYAAILRLRNRTKVEKIARAEELLRSMGLKNAADNLVGGELVKGISGGEKRRLSLAIALLENPSVLVVDEPTSGLDAYVAMNVMECLQQVAQSGVTVICSIHAPRSELWTSFDSVTLLAKGGQVIFSGTRDDCLKSFAAAGVPCPTGWNPADHLLEAISVDRRSDESVEQSNQRIENLIQSWNLSPSAAVLLESDFKVELTGKEMSSEDKAMLGVNKTQEAQHMHIALPILIMRSFKNLRRQQDVFVARVANPPFLVLIFWIFFQRMTDEPQGVQNRIGALQENSAIPFVGMLAAIAVYPAERNMFFHEYRSAARQSAATFLLSYTTLEVPMQVVSSMLYSIVFIYGFGFQGSARIFFQFFMGTFCLLNTGESIGVIFATWVPNGGLSVSLMSSALTVFAQICGIISVTIPTWLQVIGWSSALKSQVYIAAINEFSGLEFKCSNEDIAIGRCIAATGDEVLSTFGMNDRNTNKYVGIAIALCVIYRLIAWVALHGKASTL